MDNHYCRYPTYTTDVAKVLADIIEAKHKDPVNVFGIFHWSDNQNMTKYSMSMTMERVLGMPTSHLMPLYEDLPGAPRPYDAHLDNTRLIQLGISHVTTFEAGIRKVLSA